MDMEAPVIPKPGQQDDAPGATMMLRPGQAPPPPPSRGGNRVGDTVSDASPAPPPEGDVKTAFLGTAPPRPERPRRPSSRPPQPSNGAGGTDILTPDEAAAAQREALGKANRKPARSAAPPPKPQLYKAKGKRSLWLVLLGGVVVLALLLGSFAYVVLRDDESRPSRRPKTPPALLDQQADAKPDAKPGDKPADKKAEAAKPPDAPPAPPDQPPADQQAAAPEGSPPADASAKKKPAAKPASDGLEPPAPPPAEKKKAAAAPKALGTLTLMAGPTVPIAFSGKDPVKAPGVQKFPVNDGGTLVIGDTSTQFRITVDYKVVGRELVMSVNTEPWSIVSLDQISKGKAPVSELHISSSQSVLEFKKPGQEGMPVRLSFTTN
jgi:hypothetical protein